MSDLILCGLDPSYKRTGIAIYKDGIIYVRNCKTEPNSDKSFQSVWNEALGQVERIKKVLQEVSHSYTQVLSECPPPQGQFSPGLYALDSLLFKEIAQISEEVRVVYPNYMGHVHGKRGYTKSESVELAKTLLERLEKSVTVDLGSKRISHDESEAVVFLCRLFVLNGKFLNELKDVKGLFSDKDKLLIKTHD